MKTHYLIIGNCAAGISAAETIRKRDKSNPVLIVSDETYPAYARCLTSYYLAGIVQEKDLWLKQENFYRENNIDAMLGTRVKSVAPKNSLVKTEDGQEIQYQKLLIATGGTPQFPEQIKESTKGVFGLRTINDVRRIQEHIKGAKTAVVAGGGLVGLKSAYGLRKRGLKVAVVVKSPQVLSQMIDQTAAELFQSRLRENGIEIMTGIDITGVKENGSVTGVMLDNGKSLDCQIIMVGKGVQPNTQILEGTEVKIDWGIPADEYLRTNVENIFAAGDVAQAYDIIKGEQVVNAIWPSAVEQGMTAGENMSGGKKKYDGSLNMNSIEFFDLPVISMGNFRAKGPEFDIVSDLHKEKYQYKKIVLKDNRLVGLVLVGDIRTAGLLCSILRNRADVSGIKDSLLDVDFNYSDVVGLKEIPKEYMTDKIYCGSGKEN